MTTESVPVSRKRFNPLRSLGAWLRGNPVVVKELRGRMRGKRAFITLTIYLAFVTFVISLTYLLYWASFTYSNSTTLPTVSARQTFGKTVFAVVLGMELLWACVVSPALTSNSITAEREHQTYDLLRTTTLSPRALVLGKFLSGFIFILLMLFATLPLQSLAFLFGGVTPEEVLVTTLVIVVTAAGFCSLGVFCSSLFKRSGPSSTVAFVTTLIWVIVVPIVAYLIYTSNSYSNRSLIPVSTQNAIWSALITWFLLSFNPIATIIATESVAVQSASMWTYNLTVTGGVQYSVPSPWVLYVALSLLMILIWLVWSMYLVRRSEK
jgi:ABC-type transport system involved in multi-copper enzyme maturation permease subunit